MTSLAPVAPSPPLLALEAVAKTVPGGRVLFSGLDLELGRGQFLAVMGESGVGKSTLLNMIAGLDRADAGSIRIDGEAIDRLDDEAASRLRCRRIGFVFQAFHLLPHLSLAQNVALPLALQDMPGPTALARARDLLAEVGLGGRGADYPARLSGGEMQRVAIARALVHRPALILADEPTGNLDPDTAARILDLFTARIRNAGAAVLLVTHSERAAALADRTLVLTEAGLR